MSDTGSCKLAFKRFLFLARHIMLPVYEVEGTMKGVQLRMLVADDGSTLPYISHIAFRGDSTIRRRGSVNAFNAASLIDEDTDIVVAGANQLLLNKYAKQGFHIVPKWICPLFKMPDGLDTAIENLSYDARKDIRRNIRIALNKGFTHEVTTKHTWFDEFYHKVYMQYGVQKHGDLAQMDSYKRVKDSYDGGTGLIIKLCGEPVTGSIILREGNTLRARYMGVYKGQEQAAFEGGPTAMYYYAMQLAYEWGCTAVNLGSTRPFLSDGVLKFKMKWEPEILHDELSTAAFAIAAPKMTEPAAAFFAANPFFEMIGDKISLHKPADATKNAAV